jgi:hypothetical protein
LLVDSASEAENPMMKGISIESVYFTRDLTLLLL